MKKRNCSGRSLLSAACPRNPGVSRGNKISGFRGQAAESRLRGAVRAVTKKQSFILCALLLLAAPLQAEIYKWVDGNGNVHFGDKPQPGAETITLPPTQTYSPPKTSEPLPPVPQIERHTAATYTKIMIVQPQDQETIRSNQGLLSVITRVEPDLNTGDKLQLLYDGTPVGSPQTELAFTLKQIYRGSHTLQLQVINEEGTVIGTSNPVTIFMHHTRVGGGN